MVNTDIFLGSGASLTFVPEVPLYLKLHADTDGSNLTTLKLHANMTDKITMVEDLYIGCQLDFYDNGAYASTHTITGNDADEIDFTPSIADIDDAEDYFIIKSYGAPCFGPKGAGGTAVLGSATITTAGDDFLASQSVVENTPINAISNFASTGVELQLTLSSHSSDITFAAGTNSAMANYQTGYLTISLANAGGPDTLLGVAFDTDAGTTKANSGFDEYVEVNIADSSTAIQIARAVQTALANENVTVTRAGAKLTITNNTGGYVGSGTMIAMADSGGAVTDFGTLSNDVDGGVITSVEITNAGSSVSGSEDLPLTSAAGTNAVIALAASSLGGTARLNADNWLGILESATFPSVATEVKQVNLSLGGSRNMTYQYKGIETSSGGSLNVVANHGAWLYYALGQCTNINASMTAVQPSTEFVGTTAGDIYIDTGDGGVQANHDVTEMQTTGPFFYKTSSTSDKTLMPPLMISADIKTNMEKLTPTTSSATAVTAGITYTFAEANDSNLPSFALEQTLSKLPSSNTYRTDVTAATPLEDLNFVRIARGNRVSSFTMTANENEEVKMTMELMTRNVHKLKQAENYEARGGQETNTSLFNFSSSGDAELLEPFFFSSGSFSAFGQQFLKITNLQLTINNNLQEKRFVGVGSTSIQNAIPANRQYELTFTAMVTDDLLFEELFNRTENTGTGVVTSGVNFATAGLIDLQFDKPNGEEINISFKNYMLESCNVTIPEDKGPITIEAMVKPRDLNDCTVKTHWVLQG